MAESVDQYLGGKVGGVILDIEGTICPISFVKDVLFPYALSSLPSTLATQWDSPTLTPYISDFPSEHKTSPEAILSHVRDLMSQDLKIPYLKSLQGYLWRRGYATGELKCPLFGDVAPQLRSWHARGLPIIIYSSGSVEAQKLLLAHTTEDEGDLTGLVSAYYDTVNAGMKQETKSYEMIVLDGKNADIEPARWVFVSDNVAEADAAREAGLKGVLIVREGNKPLSKEERARHVVVESLEELSI